MKLKFDPNQQFQIDAVNAVVDIFDGQPLGKSDFEIAFDVKGPGFLAGLAQTELGVGNQLLIKDEALLKNIQDIQERNDIDPGNTLLGYPVNGGVIPNFSVEMETGTGKTYVYLRTIFELNRKYGFKKYIIVVPSIAIREGVLKSLQITEEHFKVLYNNIEFDYWTYDSKRISKLRQFATSNQIQILVINIDAFRKDFSGTDEQIKSNVIYKENDRLSGRQPIEFITATNPIVIIDEPQSVDNTENAQKAIRALNPLCTLRYSATHINPYNLVYRLDPVRAYHLKLVKQIVVAAVTGEGAFNQAYVKLNEVDNTKGISAKITIHIETKDGVKEKTFRVKQGHDLFELSNEREAYRHGFVISEINTEPGNEYIEFATGTRVALGLEIGGIKEDLLKVQIRNTIKTHLEKETRMKDKGIKVLSLFFIDRVANYRSYNEAGKPQQGKYARWFEEFYKELIALPQYKDVIPFPIDKLHNGYFAQDKKGIFKDTYGNSEADEDVYNTIMKDKERLLSPDEPLRFIFSHSALREGWDNPNVFQICTLNETRSALKKRQEIGRGMRLPVNKDGDRVFDENINKLLVVANESYEEFAKKLQIEYEDECGVTFGKVPAYVFSKLTRVVDGQESPIGREASESIWATLNRNGIIDQEGKILPKFDPKAADFSLSLAPEYVDIEKTVIDTLSLYQMERHVRKYEDERRLVVKKQVLLGEDFKSLWERIKKKTTYSVEFKTEKLVQNVVAAIRKMEKIEPVRVSYREAVIQILEKGLTPEERKAGVTDVSFSGALPDIIAYLQRETELTRSTIGQILIESGRLDEFAVNPQRFMDAVAVILKRELHKLMIDGIKYEQVSDQEYSMMLFEEKEIISYLSNRLEVKKSVYDAIVFESEVERKFAEDLDKREDIKLFVKLPNWFKVETPIGTYNPDWAILKHDESVLYLVRETKATKDFEQLRNAEAEKIRCGKRHFEELEVDFDVVSTASEI